MAPRALAALRGQAATRFVHAPGWFVPIAGGLAVLAWVTLWAWERGPYGRYLAHGNWTELGLAAKVCDALPGGSVLVPAMLYVSGWLLMSAAMMLPTALPLLQRFSRVVAARGDRGVLVGLLIAGYLLAWGALGVAAHLLDAGVHAAADRSAWLTRNSWAAGAAVLAVAGAFQFSRLKHHCLAKCRTPFSFIAQHWRGPAPRRSALRLGLHHGLFCVGCCWALMLLMFVVGMGNLGWMFGLGVLMALEKNAPWGRACGAVLGIALLAAAGMVVVVNNALL